MQRSKNVYCIIIRTMYLQIKNANFWIDNFPCGVVHAKDTTTVIIKNY